MKLANPRRLPDSFGQWAGRAFEAREPVFLVTRVNAQAASSEGRSRADTVPAAYFCCSGTRTVSPGVSISRRSLLDWKCEPGA